MPSSRSNSQSAVLLRHEPALQAVGEARDHALTDWTAACRDRRAADRAPRARTDLRPRRLVELDGRVGLVVGPALFVAGCLRGGRLSDSRHPRRPSRNLRRIPLRRGASADSAAPSAIPSLRVESSARSMLDGGALIVLFGLLAVLPCFGLLIAVLVAATSSSSGSLSSDEESSPMSSECEQLVHGGLGEGALVFELVAELVEFGAGLLLDPGARVRPFSRGRGRRGLPGEALAHHQRNGVLDRRIGAVAHFGEIAARIAVVQHGVEIAWQRLPCAANRSPRHAPARPHRRSCARPAPAARDGDECWRRDRQPQGHGIGMAAHDGASRGLSLRGGSGRRALAPSPDPISDGRSAAKVTSSSGSAPWRACKPPQPA